VKREPVKVALTATQDAKGGGGGRAKRFTIKSPAGNRTCSDEKLLQDKVKALKGLIAEVPPAVFGKGNETIFDPSVRHGRQLKAEKFRINISRQDLEGILKEVQEGLGLRTGVEAELHALNIYEEGGHFDAHRDTPRGDGMFGTLVLCLPSIFVGGPLEVEKENSSMEWFFGVHLARREDRFNENRSGHPSWWHRNRDNGVNIPWCAFFSDASHRVRPVKGGIRVTLTYVLRHAPAPASSSRNGADEVVPRDRIREAEKTERLVEVFRSFHPLASANLLQNSFRLGFPCEHLYTNSAFGDSENEHDRTGRCLSH
jgi:hypothetical protein